MWEANKKAGTAYPHSIEVVDTETGSVRYIKSGSKISFIEGEITETHSQEIYNKEVSTNRQNNEKRKRSKRGGKKERS